MLKKPISFIALTLLTGTLLLTACNMPASGTPTADSNAVITQAAQTVAAQLTQSAALTPSPEPSSTPVPTSSPLPATQPAAAQPTQPPAATNTSAPPAAPTSSQDNASFVADVTVPDGTGAAPGISFTKTWKIKNTGVTTWNEAYSLVWVDGDKMGFPDAGVKLPQETRPGETVEISANLVAPTKPGSYTTYFRLRNPEGKLFRLDGTGDLWVKITVGGASPTPNLTATFEYTPSTPTVTPQVTPTK